MSVLRDPQTVKRWVLLLEYTDPEPGRKLYAPPWGRYTYATKAEAQGVADLYLEPANIAQNRPLEPLIDSLHVEEVDCWVGTFAPVSIYYPPRPPRV